MASTSTEPSSFAIFFFFVKKFSEVGTKQKKELAISQVFAWIAQIDTGLIPAIWYSNVRSAIERRLYPFKLPIAHVDTRMPPFADVSTVNNSAFM